MYPGFEEYERQKAQARLGLKPWLKWPSEIERRERMNYEDQVAIGANLNEAIKRALQEYRVSNDARESNFEEGSAVLILAIAQAVLIQLDQAGYQIVRK